VEPWAALEANWNATVEGDPLPDNDGASYVADALAAALIDTFLAGIGLFLFAVERKGNIQRERKSREGGENPIRVDRTVREGGRKTPLRRERNTRGTALAEA
jgi:hypothetical protein